MSNDNEDFNVEDLLSNLFPSLSLNKLFEKRIGELMITPTKALEIMDIEYRALQGILNGTSTRVDTRNFNKLASFLNLSKEEVIRLFYKALEEYFPDLAEYPQNKKDYINRHFDLATLKRIGFIKDISNYWEVEEKVNRHFGLKSIFEYKLPTQEVAFSAGLRKPKHQFSRGFWIKCAIDAFQEFDNQYSYDKKGLMKYFPEIRWQSTNVEHGLINVISDLFKLGITVFYQSSIPSLHLKGATIVVNDKPCIVLTDYMGFYTTLWHTLCHELSHVLFDFEEIRKNVYHISDEENDELPVSEKEKAADHFAREYLLSGEKIRKIKAHINNRKFVTEFASRHQVHESFVYTYYAYEYNKIDDKAWAKAKLYNPSFETFVGRIENSWSDSIPVREHVKHLKTSNIYI